MGRTALLESITDPDLHAVAWLVEQNFRSLRGKTNSNTKAIADLKNRMITAAEREAEHLEYSKVMPGISLEFRKFLGVILYFFQTAADYRQEQKRITANKASLNLKWDNATEVDAVLRVAEKREEFVKFLYIGAPQNKNDFLSKILNELLTNHYHTHIILDLRP